jgi:hypothetical protein
MASSFLYTATSIPFIYSFPGNCTASAPVSTFICLWAIYIFPGSIHIFPPAEKADPSWEYIIRSQTHECGNWDWGTDIPFLGIFVSNFRHFVFAVYAAQPFTASYRGKVYTCHTWEEEQEIWKGASHLVCVLCPGGWGGESIETFPPTTKKVGLLYLFLFHPCHHNMHIITDVYRGEKFFYRWALDRNQTLRMTLRTMHTKAQNASHQARSTQQSNREPVLHLKKKLWRFHPVKVEPKKWELKFSYL